LIKGFHYGDYSYDFGRRRRDQKRKAVKKGKGNGKKSGKKKPQSSDESGEDSKSTEVVYNHEKPTPVQTINKNASYFNLPYTVYSATNDFTPKNKCKYKPNF
jgi:hypothetical protein